MRTMWLIKLFVGLSICFFSDLSAFAEEAPVYRESEKGLLAPTIADEELVNEKGEKVRIYTDLIRGKRIVLNFIFTSCAMTCPPTSTISANLAKRFQGDKDFRVISITVDPTRDTPEVLRNHRNKYLKNDSETLPWTLLTGKPEIVAKVLAGFEQKLISNGHHDPLYIIGNDRSAKWEKVRGISTAAALAKVVESLAQVASPAQEEVTATQAHNKKYFSDEVFTDQFGKKHRLYSDLMQGKTVLVNFGFTQCNAVCSPATRNLQKVQKLLGKRVGKEVVFLTFTVDPQHDSPAVMKSFADKHNVGKGWYFLTADRQTTERVLRKIGGWTELPDNHSGVLLYGDVDKGIWSKSSTMEQPEQIAFAITNLSNENSL